MTASASTWHRSSKAPVRPDDVVKILKDTGTDVVVNYLRSAPRPRRSGTRQIHAGVAMVNCMPVFSRASQAEAFRRPAVDHRRRHQVAGRRRSRTVYSHALQRPRCALDADAAERRRQLRLRNTRARAARVERSRRRTPSSMLDYDISADNVHVGPSDYVPWLSDHQWAYIRMEGSSFGDVPLNVEPSSRSGTRRTPPASSSTPCGSGSLNNGIAGSFEAPVRTSEVPAEADPRRRARGTSSASSSERGEGETQPRRREASAWRGSLIGGGTLSSPPIDLLARFDPRVDHDSAPRAKLHVVTCVG
jgi:hypothetical protein